MKASYRIFYFIVLSFFISSCGIKKFLPLDQYYLTKNEVVIKSEVKGKRVLEEELATLYKQTPTRKIRRWFYYHSKGRIQSRFGESPTIFDENQSANTATTIKYYLQNKGYFGANVKYFSSFSSKKQESKVKYVVDLGMPCLINEVKYSSTDKNILKIVEAVKDESLLKKGELLSVSAYNSEVNRLTKIIRNFGYASFYPNFITPLDAVDTSDNKASIKLTILPPEDTSNHRKYRIRNIQLFTEYVTTAQRTQKDTVIEGVTLSAPSGEFNLKLSQLMNCIPIRSGEDFRQENLDLMYSRFEQMKTFRLINIKQSLIPNRPGELDISIILAQNNKFSMEANGELNYTVGGTRSNAIGTSASFTFKNNNVFKGGEKYIMNFEGGIQGILLSKNQIFGEIKFQNEYYIPKSVDIYGVWKRLHDVKIRKLNNKIDTKYSHLVSDNFYEAVKNNAQTRFSGGYNYIQTFDLRYQLMNLNYGYVILPSQLRKVSFNHTSIEWLKPIFLGPAIDTLPFQKKRFTQQLVTALIFKDLSFSRLGGNQEKKTSWTMKTSFEQSGLELFGANILYNTITIKDTPLKIFGQDYSRYLKSEFEFAFGKKFNNFNSFHFRTITGVATPYGFNTSVPFVKQFSVGGPSSLRAWRVRELGPGSSVLQKKPNNQLYYQTGDIKSELNLEYRFGIYWIFKGAFFVDVGNVWLIKKDSLQPGAEISKNFYKELAIGSGFGLRIDFDYSIIRFDFAYKIRNPYQNTVNNSYWNIQKAADLNPKNLNWSIALGYPF